MEAILSVIIYPMLTLEPVSYLPVVPAVAPVKSFDKTY